MRTSGSHRSFPGHGGHAVCLRAAEQGSKSLPSARVKIFGKVYMWQNSVHSGTKMASLPSVCAMTLGKDAKILCILGRVCGVPSIRHSAKDEGLPSASNVTHGKGGSFAECLECDTRQRRKCLPSAWKLTHDKEAKFAECLEFDTRKVRNVCRVPEI